MRSESKILIVGSDSFIGGALMEYLQGTNNRIAGTTRRRESVDESHPYLDLTENMEKWQCNYPIDAAVVCAGVTKINACRIDSATSAKINIEGTVTLIKNLVSKGIFVLYLSTDKVFDGSKPHRLPNDSFSPITEYGRQKAEVERQISKLYGSVGIIRLSKVLGKEDPLFRKWVLDLQQQKTIYPFLDMMLAPIHISTVVTVIGSIIEKKIDGVMQLSGNEDISYAEAAFLGAKSVGLDESLIKPIKAKEKGYLQEESPKHTTMDTSRLRDVLGIEPPDVRQIIRKNFVDIASSLEDSN